MRLVDACLLLFVFFYLLPLGFAAAIYRVRGDATGWRTADRSSIGHLSPASQHRAAVVRVFAARTVSWRGIFASHCWIVFKSENASAYTRYDYTAWGEPIRVNGFEPDGRWFGQVPDVVLAIDGEQASSLISRLQAAIRDYAWRNHGDYRAWPGPNSNTFIAAILDAVPEIHAALPSTALGKDFPYDHRWLRRTSSGLGVRLTLGGYVGLTLGWVEGIELNILGAVAGIDVRRPAIKLAALGRFGMSAHSV